MKCCFGRFEMSHELLPTPVCFERVEILKRRLFAIDGLVWLIDFLIA